MKMSNFRFFKEESWIEKEGKEFSWDFYVKKNYMKKDAAVIGDF